MPADNATSAKLFTTEQGFADAIGASLGYVRRLRYEGKGPKVFRIGRLVRYRLTGADSIDAWVASGVAATEMLGVPTAVPK